MDTRRQFSSMSMSEKRDRLMLLAINLKMRKRKLTKRKLVKLGNLVKEESSNTENRDTKPKMKLNGHLYKKMFQKAGQKQKMMLLNQVDDKIVEGSCAKRSCTGPKRKRKKRRIALLSERFGFGKRESVKEPSQISSMVGLTEMSLTDQLKIFEDYHQLVNANKLLAEFIIHHCDDTLNLHGPDKDTSSIAVPQVPASATVRQANPCSTSVRPANPCSTSFRPANLRSKSVLTPRFSGQNIGMRGLRAPAPHLRSPSLFSSVHNPPAAREPFLEPLPTLSTLETLPHIQTAPNTGVHQVDLKNIPKLPMEFDKYYGMGGPNFPILSSNHNTS